jgi:multiple sugar transport system substrate-binding protein
MMIQMLKQYGGEYSNEDGDLLIFNDTTKDILYTVAENTDTGAFNTFAEVSYPADLLNRGQCVFAIDSTAGSVWMGREGPLSTVELDEAIEFELGISEIPQPSAESKPQMISQGPSMCVFNKADPQEVLASWLFAQFMITNEVQIAYACTEGYAPVTLKAQNSSEYLDYLSREGEDGETYYEVKLKATKLLLDNIDNTFVTPVFNGSTSLRDAAGQMIENVTKSVRRNEVVDEQYFPALYEKISSLYHLDVGGDRAKEKAELGPMPAASVALIVTLVTVWALMGCYFGVNAIKKAKTRKK